MPGLIGSRIKDKDADEVYRASKSLVYDDASYKLDPLFKDNYISASRAHLNIIGENNSPTKYNHLFCWVEGEIYNLDKLYTYIHSTLKSEAQLLLESFASGKLEEVLAKADGYYCAVIYDQLYKKIYLISDRYGFKPLYYYSEGGNFIWSSEIKAFLSFSSFKKIIRKDVVNWFLKLGYIPGNHTYFKNTYRLGPSSILCYSISNNNIESLDYYWTWDNISLNSSLTFNDSVYELGDFFTKAVDSCVNEHEYSLSLSGGIDSRAILGALRNNGVKIKPFSFGRKSSYELEIAHRVSKKMGLGYHFFAIDQNNWLNKRLEGIWNSDGQCQFTDMHATQHHLGISRLSPISFNGFAGDLVLGGSWIRDKDVRISNQTVLERFNVLEGDVEKNEFYNINKEDAYFINNRVRKFTSVCISEIKYFETRIPFFNNGLIEFVYSLPDAYRYKGRIYEKMLLNKYPDLFKSIPSSSSGVTIGGNKRMKFYTYKIKSKFNHVFGKDNKACFDYRNWLVNSKSIFNKILTGKEKIYPEILGEEIFNFDINSFKLTDENFYLLIRVFTLEVYFQQVFNQKLLNTKALESLE